jgi:hypothetical protein
MLTFKKRIFNRRRFCLFEITVTDGTVCRRKRQHLMMMDDQMDTDDSGSVVEERSHHGDTVCYPSPSTSQDLNITQGILPIFTISYNLHTVYVYTSILVSIGSSRPETLTILHCGENLGWSARFEDDLVRS